MLANFSPVSIVLPVGISLAIATCNSETTLLAPIDGKVWHIAEFARRTLQTAARKYEVAT